jgi:predicted nucleic acid-binding protein
MRYYLDAVIIIYAVENTQPFAPAVDAKLSVSDLTLVTSELSRLECRVKPLRDGNTKLLQDFDKFFINTINELVPLTRDVIDCATELRARYNLKTPDTLHLGAALVSNCDVFLTNDQRLSRCQEIMVETI